MTMLKAVALLVVFVACAAFMISRLYLLVFRGELNVKGGVYSRRSTPVLYWIMAVLALAGTLITVSLTLIFALAFGEGFIVH